MTEKLTDAQAQERQSWQFRCIEATRGNQTRLGTMLLAILGRNAKHPPKFGPGCVISLDGYVFANFVDRQGIVHAAQCVCSVGQMNDGFRLLADSLKLDDADRIALFDEVRKWVYKDERATSTLN